MALHVDINDPKISIEPESTRSVELKVDIPEDSHARTKDVGITMIIKGKIMADAGEVGKPADSTAKLLEWSKIPAEKKEAYRNVVVKVQSGAINTRMYQLPNAYIVDYYEDFNDQEGTGLFTLVLKQMKNKLSGVMISGGFTD
ncbi:MAG: membrane-associated protease 1 [Selenomonadaceae bacterium]|nr:membrane-associated protease 1 [Selenomonadaceae bacterium]